VQRQAGVLFPNWYLTALWIQPGLDEYAGVFTVQRQWLKWPLVPAWVSCSSGVAHTDSSLTAYSEMVPLVSANCFTLLLCPLSAASHLLFHVQCPHPLPTVSHLLLQLCVLLSLSFSHHSVPVSSWIYDQFVSLVTVSHLVFVVPGCSRAFWVQESPVNGLQSLVSSTKWDCQGST
jgi:hypothetical protein